MIPSHLSALPCGDCRNPTVTTTLQRVGNRFVCPQCRESAVSQTASGPDSWLSSFVYTRTFIEIRRVAALCFLAASVTGFIVLPTCFDPAELAQRELSSGHTGSSSLKANIRHQAS